MPDGQHFIQRLAHGAVPEVPGMALVLDIVAGERDAHAVQLIDDAHIVGEAPVAAAGAEDQLGNLHPGLEQLFRAAEYVEAQRGLLHRPLVVSTRRAHDETRRIEIRVLEAGFHAGVAAVGKAADEIVLALVAQRQDGAEEGRQLLGDIGIVVLEEILPLGHDHSDLVLIGIAHDVGEIHPVAVVAAAAVQQPERLIFHAGLHKALAAVLLVHAVTGQDHGEVALGSPAHGEVVDVKQCHNKFLL